MENKEKTVEKGIYDINLAELLQYVLSKWYLLLFSGLIISAMMLGIVRFCKIRQSEGGFNTIIEMEIKTESEAKQVEDLLVEDDFANINICRDKVARLQELKEYMTNAVLMQIDPYECKRLTVVYEASSDSLVEARNLIAQYISFATSEDVMSDAISDAIGDYERKNHISDVITATEEQYFSEEGRNIVRVDFSVVLLPEWNEEAVVDAIRNSVESYSIKSESQNGDVEFVFLKSFSKVKYYADIKSLQTSIFNQYNSDISGLNNAIRALNRPSALLYNYYLKKNGLGGDYMVTISKPTSSELLEYEESKGVSGKLADVSYFKMFIMSGVAGVGLMAWILVLILLIRGRAGRVLGISVISDKPLYGIIKFDKSVGDNASSDIRIVVENILYCLQSNNFDSICFLTIGEAETDSLDSLEGLLNCLNNTTDIMGKSICISLRDPNRYKILSSIMEPVILCIKFEENKIKELIEIEQILSNGNINVLGSVGIEAK